MFTMTYNEAMLIQRAQMCYNRQRIGRKGIKAIKAKTICPSDINPNEQMSVIEINKLVPRGGSFEAYFTDNMYNFEHDRNNLAWHEAIKRGFV